MCSVPSPLRRAVLSISAGTVLVLWASVASAGTLQGRLVDSLTGTPIPGAEVRVLGTERRTRTDADGSWSFELPDGEYELAFHKRLGDRHYRMRLVRQRVPQYKPADSTIATPYYLRRGARKVARPRGAPVDRIDHPSARDRGSIDLGEQWTRPPADESALTLPESAPRTIRVARYENPENCNNTIVAIEEIPLDEYVRGVLPPEIGVFRNLDNIEETYETFGLAAKSFGLYFMLVYGPENRRTTESPKPPNGFNWYHIDDTPCNQRYSDQRLQITTRAADSQAGRILVKQGAPDTLDRFEYAASCGHHGTRPEYQDAIVPDEPPTESCVGDWCGHESCAGHEDHPQVSGSDRCLVRGICQWGAAEWAEAGRDFRWILDHYQPNLQIRRLWEGDRTATVELKGFVHTDPSDVPGSGVPEATVELESGETTRTDSRGLYSFPEIEVSRDSATVTASKSEFETARTSVELTPGRTNWASIHIERAEGVERADAGTRTDSGPPLDAASDATTPGRYGGLGPLVTRSAGGRSSGCSVPPHRDTPVPLRYVVFGAFVGIAVRRF